MSTALQLVNKVLRRLREDDASSFSNSYTKLILDFVNESKREVEDAWNWTALRTTKTITTVGGTRQYALTGAGDRYRILDAWNTTSKFPLLLTTGQFVNSDIESGTSVTGQPSMYRVYGQDSSGDPYLDFYPVPGGVYTLTFYLHVPQADMTAINDTLIVPEWPVVLGAWAKAISERGEDGGQNTIEQQMMYRSALADAIAIDESRTLLETTWQPV